MGIIKFIFTMILGVIILAGFGQAERAPINAIMCWLFVITAHITMWPWLDMAHQDERDSRNKKGSK
jgi:hypothetical protein